jgi:hypothetical protein
MRRIFNPNIHLQRSISVINFYVSAREHCEINQAPQNTHYNAQPSYHFIDDLALLRSGAVFLGRHLQKSDRSTH